MRKFRFSVTNASAPTHSVYAAMKASADFNPLGSYLTPSSKGIKISSSIPSVESCRNWMNATISAGLRFLRTSLKMSRGILIRYLGRNSMIWSSKRLQGSFFLNPKEKIYSLLSRTSSKLFFPEMFASLTQMINNFLFAHVSERRRSLSNRFSDSCKMFFSFPSNCYNSLVVHLKYHPCYYYNILLMKLSRIDDILFSHRGGYYHES